MIVNEGMKLKGFFKIEGIDKETGEQVFLIEKPNMLTTINQTYRQKMLDGTFLSDGLNISDLQIKYIALGTGTTDPAVSDIKLESESTRKAISSISSSGEITTTICSFSSSDANFRIREIGVFCGAAATSTADTGIMISRILVDFTKTENIVLNIYRFDKCTI